jgi:hypothetical protein
MAWNSNVGIDFPASLALISLLFACKKNTLLVVTFLMYTTVPYIDFDASTKAIKLYSSVRLPTERGNWKAGEELT